MQEPVRIFSDLHLGHKASRIKNVESLRPLFSGVGTAIFNGDTWEELVPKWRDKSEEMLLEMQELLRSEGCEAIFIPGNHDPSWGGTGYIELGEQKILITHGDALLRDGAPWKREVLANQDMIDQLWKQYPGAVQDLDERLKLARAIAIALPTKHNPDGFRFLSRAFDAAYPPSRAVKIIFAWLQQAQLGSRFCRNYRPHSQFLIYGHFHRCGFSHVNGITSVNTGSFVVPGSAGFVDWNDSSLSFGRVLEDGKTFTPAKARMVRDFSK